MLKRLFQLCIFSACLALGGLFYVFTNEWFDFSELENYDPGQASVVLDANGKEMFKFQLDKRTHITYNKLPDILIKAFIAAEDRKFFEHKGISFKGLVRSFLVNLYHRKFVQGASTITQQLIRLLFLSTERKLLRKIKEIFLSMSLERKLTKQQIMELYLNNIYFGRGIYGVEAACRRFWNKSAQDVNSQEAAVLAAVAKSAWFYSPLNSPEKSRKRRNIILRSMYLMGYISENEFNTARKTSLNLEEKVPGNPIRLYIQEWVRNWAEARWGREALYKKGLKIKTSIDVDMQATAEEEFKKVILELRETQGNKLNGGMVVLDTKTGRIRAAVGGLDFNESQYNRAFQSVRQMGSVFKPILYAAAVKHGKSFADVMVDEPIELDVGSNEPWKPRNWNRKFDGPMTLVRALTTSNNMITIKTLLDIGVDPVIELAKKFGVTRNLVPYPSIALGIAEATIEETAAVFNVFANDGHYTRPYMIEWVKNQWGQKLFDTEVQKTKVLDSITNSKMVNALGVFMERRRIMYPKQYSLDTEATGKSGSTNDSTSNWYVGSTPELTTAVYIGRDDSKGMGRYVFSSQTAYPIWFNFNKKTKYTQKTFYLDPKLKEKKIDWITGEPTNNVFAMNAVSLVE